MQTEFGRNAGVACKSLHESVISGTVCAGSSRGRKLGFPTANLQIGDERAPDVVPGVYGAGVEWDDGPRYSAVVNVGCRPTFEEGGLTFEVHVLNFTGNLYGKDLYVTLAVRIRDEKRFEGVDALVAQIQKDIEQARNWFADNEVHHRVEGKDSVD